MLFAFIECAVTLGCPGAKHFDQGKVPQSWEKSRVFKLLLKVNKSGEFLRLNGSSFHALEAPEIKLLPPQLAFFTRGIRTCLAPEERRVLPGMYHWNFRLRKSGPIPLMALKMVQRALKCILCLTGSQCSHLSSPLTEENLGIPVSNLAAAFCTSCSRLICCFWALR